ncbi:hypothetical protein [Falsiroseomonas sp. E2-1-a20]|uniref:hypothetical protein n=1 Tax=Falsiroseomonas sp. E2-1-a20 TaxID=3239300 RepID=UPI003F31A674
MAAGQKALAAVVAAIEAGRPEAAAAQYDAAGAHGPAEALVALLLLDRRAALAAVLAPALADAATLGAVLRDLGLRAEGSGPDPVAAVRKLAGLPDAENPRAHLASLFLDAGRPRLAEALLLPAWQHAATSALIARALSGTWMLLGQDSRALEAARIAVDAAPEAPEPLEHLAGLLLRAGQPGPALLAAGRAWAGTGGGKGPGPAADRARGRLGAASDGAAGAEPDAARARTGRAGARDRCAAAAGDADDVQRQPPWLRLGAGGAAVACAAAERGLHVPGP